MKQLQRLPGSRTEPPGMERAIWLRLPRALIAVTIVPILFVVLVNLFPPEGNSEIVNKHLKFADIMAISLAVTGWTAVLTLALGCFVVRVMKGPAYVADRYDLIDSNRPKTEHSEHCED